MISLVLISHSATLAAGVKDLVDNATGGKVPVAIAGGAGASSQLIGTDAITIKEAIQSVFSPDGVIVLADLGSAVINMEMALELLTDDQRSHVFLSPAPLVEGAVAAASHILAGGDVEEVLAEAQSSLAAKIQHLGTFPPPSEKDDEIRIGNLAPVKEQVESPPSPWIPPAEISRDVCLINKLGIHARPAVQIIQCASRFKTQVTIENRSRSAPYAPATSLNAILLLEGKQGDILRFHAAGADAEDALNALAALVESGFGEVDQSPEDQAPSLQFTETTIQEEEEDQKCWRAIPASAGVALAPLAHLRRIPVPAPEQQTGQGSQVERQKLAAALALAAQEIQELETWARHKLNSANAAIFTAQLLFLSDPDLLAEVYEGIDSGNQSAAYAWYQAVRSTEERLTSVEDDYLRSRAIDVVDAAERVQAHLSGSTHWMPTFNLPVILAARDLLPSQVGALDLKFIHGILLAAGSPTSHSLILARGIGIPAVVMAGSTVFDLRAGTLIGLDGSSGEIWIQPDAALQEVILNRRKAWLQERQTAFQIRQLPAFTRSGERIRLLANISNLSEARQAIENGADGVGLLRTELLFTESILKGRTEPPGEEEQYAQYLAIANVMGERPLVIRVLDAGGDKPLPYLSGAPETNPFLGLRGIRLLLTHQALFKTQIRAILRASATKNIRLLLPMVAQPQEIRASRALLEEVKNELIREKISFNPNLLLGIMIETPAAAWLAKDLAKVSDFFSIGSNDLAQYVMAADRTSSSVSPLADAFQPAVLRTIYQVIEIASSTQTPISLCGELAGDPLAAPLLAGMGLREFSMRPLAIPEVKLALSRIEVPEVTHAIQEILKLESAEAIRAACQVIVSMPSHPLEYRETGKKSVD